MTCGNPNCFHCAWLVDSTRRMNDALKAALLADAPRPVTVQRWLPGEPNPQAGKEPEQ